MKQRNWLAGLVLAVAVTIFMGIVVWQFVYPCVRWETRTHFANYADRTISVCVESRLRWSGQK